MKKHVIAVTMAILTALTPYPAHAHGDAPEDIDELIHAAAAYRGAPYWTMYNILRCESGAWDRRVINGTKPGSSGELGIAQILPSWTPAAKRYGSLGALFESRTGDYSASDSIYFMAWALVNGYRGHWHC